jgi:hypothetical protein
MGFFSDIYDKVKTGVSSLYEGAKKTITDVSKGFYSAPGGYRYCGPGNPITREYIRDNPPINESDRRCLQHDLDYENFKKTGVKGKELADLVRDSDTRLVEGLQSQKDRDVGSYFSEYGIRAKKALEDWGLLKPEQFVT